MPNISRHLIIEGRVQGVGFRWAMTQTAQTLGIHGWVRNLRDGSVEAMISGEERAVIKALAWAQHGPANSRVDKVTVAIGSGEFCAFTQRDTV